MKRLALPALLLGLLVASAQSGSAAEQTTEQEKAVAEIEKLGGWAEIDQQSPSRPVIEVGLPRTLVTDRKLECLKRFSQLQSLTCPLPGSLTEGYCTWRG